MRRGEEGSLFTGSKKFLGGGSRGPHSNAIGKSGGTVRGCWLRDNEFLFVARALGRPQYSKSKKCVASFVFEYSF